MVLTPAPRARYRPVDFATTNARPAARGTWRGRARRGCGRANAAAHVRGPELVPPEVLAGLPKRGAAPSNIGARANFCAGRRETTREKVTGRAGCRCWLLELLLCASCEASWGGACLLARKNTAREGKCGIL